MVRRLRKTYLQLKSSVQNRSVDLCDSTGDQETCRQDTDDGGDGQDLLDKVREELVGSHTNSNRSQDNLNGRESNTDGINRNDGTQDSLAQKRGHENSSQSGGRSHEDRQSNVSAGNVCAKVRGLSSVDTSDQNHTGQHSGIQAESFTQSKGQKRHHSVAKRKLHGNRNGFLHDVEEILRGQSDTHGKHQSGQSCGEVFGGEPSKGCGGLQSGSRKDDGPKWEESSGNTGSFDVSVENLCSKSDALGSSVLTSGFGLPRQQNKTTLQMLRCERESQVRWKAEGRI